MKRTLKKVSGLLLALCMLLILLQTAAYAVDTSVSITGKSITETASAIQTALDAASSGDTITVTGTLEGATSTLTLNIPSGVTVVWNATLTADSSFSSYFFLNLDGAGTFDMATGTVSTASTTASNVRAIYDANSSSKIIVEGGSVSAATGYAIDTVGAVTVTGGSVSVTDGLAISSNGAVTVSGTGTIISATTGSAIGSNGNVTVEGGSISTTGGGGYAISSQGSVSVSGANTIVSATTGYAISSSSGTVTVSGGTVSATSGNAIWSNGDVAVSGADTIVTTTTGTVINSQSKVTVEGGTVSVTEDSEYADAICSSGAVTVSNGTVSVTTGTAIFSNGNAIVDGASTEVSATTGTAISSNGNVTVKNGSVSTTSGYAIWSHGDVAVSGGTVSATGDEGIALCSYGYTIVSGGSVSATTGYAIESYGDVAVSGGAVSATTGYAICDYDASSSVTVEGGTVFAYGAEVTGQYQVIYQPYVSAPFTSATGTGIVIAWNNEAAAKEYVTGYSSDLSFSPSTATVGWATQDSKYGISYENGANSGFIEISGVTVSGSAPDVVANNITAYSTSLIPAVDGNTVTVTGTLENASSTLTLEIPSSVTVVWKATMTADSSFSNQYLINLSGTGTFEVAEGGTVTSAECAYTAINSSGNVTVSGGLVSTTGNGGFAISSSGTVTVSSGSVSATDSGGTAIYSSGNVTVSGGSVSAMVTDGRAIYDTNASSTITVEGGSVSATAGYAIYSNGSVTVSGTDTVVSATTGQAIHLESGDVTVSGGSVTVSGLGGYAIYTNNSAVTITVEGGIVSTTVDYGGHTVYSTGAVTVSGGTVSTSSGTGQSIQSYGTVTVSGGSVIATGSLSYAINPLGGDVVVSGGTVSATGTYGCAIYSTNASSNITVQAGTVSLTGFGGYAIESSGTVTVSGGTVSTLSGYDAIYGTGTSSSITVSGGLVFAYGTAITGEYQVIYQPNATAPFTSATGTGVVIAWGPSTESKLYVTYDSSDLYFSPSAATVYWATQDSQDGIYYDNGANSGFIVTEGVTVSPSLASAIADVITSYSSSLSAEIVDKTVIVTGTLENASSTLTLEIPSGLTVVWKATIAADNSFTDSCLIKLTGPGTFEVAENGTVTTAAACYAIDAEAGTLTVDGGTVSITGSSGTAIYTNGSTKMITMKGGSVSANSGLCIQSYSGDVVVTGGSVSAISGTAIFTYSNAVTVSGGSVSSITGYAIYSGGDVTISGTDTVVSVDTIYAIGVEKSGVNVTVSGGTVKATSSYGYAIYTYDSTDTITIEGGSVINTSVDDAHAIYSEGAVTVSGGSVSCTKGRVIESSGDVTIDGGSVSVTGDGGYAIYGKSASYGVTVSGGTVSATTGYAIYSNGSVAVSGGMVFAYGTAVTGENQVIYQPDVTTPFTAPTGTGIVIAWNNNSGTTEYNMGDCTDLSFSPSTATVCWATQSSDCGISYTNSTNTGFIAIDGITVSDLTSTYANAIVNTITSYSINLSPSIDGSTVTVTGTLENASSTLTLNIPNGMTVVWKATITADSNFSGTYLLELTGAGTFEVAENGTVSTPADGGCAIYSDGAVTVSDGTVSATTGYAIYGTGTSSSITVSGGMVFAYGTTITGENQVIYQPNASAPFTSPTGTGIVIAWNNSTGTTQYVTDDSIDLSFSPSAATVCWATQDSESGISYTNGTNTGFIAIDGVTLNAPSEPVSFTVTFNANGGSVSTTSAQTTNGSLTSLPTPTRADYSFSGWYTADSGGTEVTTSTVFTSNTIIYAHWTYTGSSSSDDDSSSDSGSSYSGGPSSSSSSSLTVSGSTAITTIKATAGSDGTASVSVTLSQINSAINAAQAAAESNGGLPSVEIQVDVSSDATAVETTLPESAVQALVTGKIDSLSISSPVATMTFSSGAIETISVAGSGDVTFHSGIVDKSTLNEDQQASVGDRPVYSFSVTVGGTTVSEFGGSVTVSIPYTLHDSENPDAIVVYYVDASGSLQMMQGSYDETTGMVTFETSHFSVYMIGYNEVTFDDVSDTDWYYDAVTFLAARGITTGSGDDGFSPDVILTRGQFITMLLRAYGISADENPTDNFSDAGNTYYTGYLAVAKELGISNGIGNNMFAPEKAITRQEMITMLYNALKVLDELPSGNSGKALSDFSDASSIAVWAQDAMTLLVETGTVSGNNGKLSPTDTTTRAEMAQVLYNMIAK